MATALPSLQCPPVTTSPTPSDSDDSLLPHATSPPSDTFDGASSRSSPANSRKRRLVLTADWLHGEGDLLPQCFQPDTFSKPASGSSEDPEPSGWFRTFTVSAYRPYFDVDTSDVLERIKDSLFPFRGTFSEKTANNPDLYGPFWICTTLIFVAASIGTFVTYVAHMLEKKEWDYDINLLTWSAGLFYGYVTIVPLGLYVILKYFSVPSGLVQLFCLYGYSLFIFIPALCLSIVPIEVFRWVIAGVAGFMSATFVALNLRAHIKSAGERWFLIVAAIFLLQVALGLALKFYLFTVVV